MAYNLKLAQRISRQMKPHKSIVEKKMFGGVCYMLKKKMICGIVKDELMVRVLDDKFERLLKKPHAREMDFTGRPMKGFLYVSPAGIKTAVQLNYWLAFGVEYALRSTPKKKKKTKE